jgi:cation transport protein ChaC
MSDFWVFGYGSLMWRPGFDHIEAVPARLPGAHRALCVYSWVHRGTREKPGLVLGLDRGGSCRGMAFRVAGEKRESVIDYLRERELVTEVYRAAWRPVRLEGGHVPQMATALTYLVDRQHEQYAGALSREEQLRYVRNSVGRSGINRDYVINTASHLASLGIKDPVLEWLAKELKQPS